MGGMGITKIKANPVTDKLRSGQPAVGSWLSLCSPVAAESMATVGWDWLVVDAEHSPVGFETMVNCFRAIQLGGAVPMVLMQLGEVVFGGVGAGLSCRTSVPGECLGDGWKRQRCHQLNRQYQGQLDQFPGIVEGGQRALPAA